jgi:mRNA-degrading endonuclease toxin of MazEF toxin-antitoxin module
LTTSSREHALRLSVGVVDGKSAKANISQMRVVDTRRLEEKIGFLDKEAFETVRKAARAML